MGHEPKPSPEFAERARKLGLLLTP